jgi:hypothetical protein
VSNIEPPDLLDPPVAPPEAAHLDRAEDARAVRRVTIKLTSEAYTSLRSLADDTGLSLTVLIRQALAMYRFFHEHRDARIFLKEPNGESREVFLVGGR